jgi:hypothetical protein
MAEKNIKRAKSAATGDKYLSPPVIVKELQKIVKEYVKDGDTLWDPAAHDGRLLQPFKAEGFEVRNSDNRPEEGVETLNFLDDEARRPSNAKRMMVVMNPPFKLNKGPWVPNARTHGVTYFLNKASKVLKEGEFVITVCPPTVSNYNQLRKAAKQLILKREYNFSKPIKFTDFDKSKEKGKEIKKNIYTTIQVWERGSDETISPTSKLVVDLTKEELKGMDVVFKNYASATPVIDDPPICYIARNQTGKDCGRVYTSEAIYGKNKRTGYKMDYEPKTFMLTMTPFTSPRGLKYNEGTTKKEKSASGLVAVYVRDKSKTDPAYVISELHYLFLAGYYARYLGYYLFDGIQTINKGFMEYLYMNRSKVPTRESLGIETFTIGDPPKPLGKFKAKIKSILTVRPALLGAMIQGHVLNFLNAVKKEVTVKQEVKYLPKLKF